MTAAGVVIAVVHCVVLGTAGGGGAISAGVVAMALLGGSSWWVTLIWDQTMSSWIHSQGSVGMFLYVLWQDDGAVRGEDEKTCKPHETKKPQPRPRLQALETPSLSRGPSKA
jgi:hypothetical protein